MVDLEAARERLGGVHQPLIDAHAAAAQAWETFVTERPELAKPCGTTTQKNFIHNHICAEVSKRVDGAAGVELTECLDFVSLKVGSEILLRFKAVDHGGPRNVATRQQRLLARQEFTEGMTLALTGDPALTPPTLLTCGYALDGPKIGRIEIRRDCKGHLPWAYDIFGGNAVNQPIVLKGLEDTAKPATVRTTTKPEEDTGNRSAESA